MKPARLFLLLFLLFPSLPAGAEQRPLETGAFGVHQEVIVPGNPDVVYDALTGDISPWWDHAFSDAPARFFIEAKPGGGFWEYFDASGTNGVRHATVIYAERGKLLRMDGPLGLSGNAVQIVTTYALAPAGADSTRITLTLNAAGQMEATWPDVVDRVWHHFLTGRFKPFMEAGGRQGK